MTFFQLFFTAQTFLSLLISMLLFCMHCEKRAHFAIKLAAASVAAVAVSTWLWYLVKTQQVRDAVGLFGIIACNIFYIAELIGICMLCFKCKPTEMLIYVVAGWVTQHLSGMLSSITARLLGIQINYIDYTWEYFLITVLSYAIVYTAVWFLFSRIRRNSTLKLSLRITVPSAVMFCVMILLNTYMPYDASPQAFYIMRSYSVACCVVMLFLIFSAFRESDLSYNLDVITQLERKSRSQYEMAKESVDIINTKCHDLKKLLAMVGGNVNVSQAEIAEIRSELEMYDAIVKTGNKAFDTIVTEKSLYCSRNAIKLAVIADVRSIDFIGDIDMYSLFGNILDNAIEAVTKLDGPRRIINMTVREVNSFVSVHAENCFDGALKLRDGLPVTTKDDKIEHGYGVASIRHTVKKYGGEVTVSADNGVFALDILIPIS